jgi:hypothetical protein
MAIRENEAGSGTGDTGVPLRKPAMPESNVTPSGNVRKRGSTVIAALADMGAMSASTFADDSIDRFNRRLSPS